MKLALATLLMFSALPVSAESIGDRSNRRAYQSQSGYARQENASSESIVRSMSLALCVILGMLETYKKKGLLFLVNLEQRSITGIITTMVAPIILHKEKTGCVIMMITLASKVQFLVASVVLVSVLLLPEVMVVSGQSL